MPAFAAFISFVPSTKLMEIIGYIAAVFIGITLGLLGGGGAILTVPVLVYFFRIEPVAATTYSLFIVGTTSVSGSVNYYIKGLVDFRLVLAFGMPSIAGVFLSRCFLLPAIPERLVHTSAFSFTKNEVLMLLFAILMIIAALCMICRKEKKEQEAMRINKKRMLLLLAAGCLTGAITGLLGAGGGFLIIPALVLCFGINMKKAVATSLSIISLNSLLGFVLSVNQSPCEWPLFLTISAIAVTGIFIGSRLSGMVNTAVLKKMFGLLLIVIATVILFRELY